MYLGKIVETAPADQLYSDPSPPLHAGAALRGADSRPEGEPEREQLVLEGDVPSPIDPPSACRFHTRCPYATEICSTEEPPLADYGRGRIAACHHPLNVTSTEVQRARVVEESPATATEQLPRPQQATTV